MGTSHSADEWLAITRAQLLRGDTTAVEASLSRALSEHPRSVELRRAQAGIFVRAGRHAEAESLLRDLLDGNPEDLASVFSLANCLKDQGRTSAAATVVNEWFAAASNRGDADLAISAIEFLDGCGQKVAASEIANAAIVDSPRDARLHAYAGMLQIQLGDFEAARENFLFALKHDQQAWGWHVSVGLASTLRYTEQSHPDIAMFAERLQRGGLSELARAELHFALGKAHDDVGAYERAVPHFREGNALREKLTKWTRKAWRRAVEARLAARPIASRIQPSAAFTPIFIVGMLRSGTTLLAELLGRHPDVRNRGELPWIARLAIQPAFSGSPTQVALERAARTYMMHARQDDAAGARWFIDKQPLNFRYLDLIFAMFPQAKIIHCRRGERDNALSLWTQCFLEEIHGYTHAFGDIALVMNDCNRLMAHWGTRHADSIRSIRYEELVANPQTVIADLAQWIGLSKGVPCKTPSASPTSTISTASLWQARQPITTRSVGRWNHYAQYLPELLRFPN